MPAVETKTGSHSNPSPSPKAGWSITDWCASVNLSRATLYTLPPGLQPASVKVGKRRIITEQPTDYLKRLASQPYAEAA